MAKRKAAAGSAAASKADAPATATAAAAILDEVNGAIAAGAGGLVGSDAEMLYLDVIKSVRDRLEGIDLAALLVAADALEVLRGEHAGALDTIATRDMRIAELEAAAGKSAAGGCRKCGSDDHAGPSPCGCACHVPIETRYQKAAELIEELVASPEAAVVDRAKLRAAIKTALDDLSGIVR